MLTPTTTVCTTAILVQALMEEGDALDEIVTEQRTAAAAKEKEVLFLIPTNNILSYKVLFLHCKSDCMIRACCGVSSLRMTTALCVLVDVATALMYTHIVKIACDACDYSQCIGSH
jgi:hypothetical protein